MNSIKHIPVIFLIFFSNNLFSQISGISASKLVVINTETVPKNKIEFEPAFNFSISNSDSLQTNSNFGFRFTYGLNDKTEIGISLPINMNGVNWGIKYHAIDIRRLSLGIIAGIENTLFVNNFTEADLPVFFKSYATGFTSTYQISNKLSIDFDSQVQSHFHYSKQDFHLFINSELGYFIKDGLQLAGGFQYGNNPLFYSPENSLIFNSGLTVEKAENFILVLNFPYQFKIKQSNASIGFAMALTILID